MKVMICASVSFAAEMLKAKKILENNGHTVLLTGDVAYHIEHPQTKLDFKAELKFAVEKNVLDEGFKKIAESDAILVLNYPKNEIKGYLGTAVLMEMALAYYLKKKIFLLNEIDKSQRYALEVQLINPTVIGGDFNRIR